MVRKMSVSPTVTSPLTCGIGTLRRAATVAMTTIRSRKRQSSCCRLRRYNEKSNAPAPAMTMKIKNGLKKRCLVIILVHDLLVKIDRVVILVELETSFSVTNLCGPIRLVNKQANRLGPLQKMIGQLRHAARAIAISPVHRVDIHAFEINYFRSLTNDVGFELQLSVFNGKPDSSLLDAARTSL